MTKFIIGVAGGSGSGKSTVTNHIVSSIGSDKVSVIRQDSYYKDLSHLSLDDRRKVNLDHPDMFDWSLLSTHIRALYNNEPVAVPTYDFSLYVRCKEFITVKPTQIVIFEGIFALMDPQICELMGLKIFVDTAADVRLIRRMQRDILERGRTVELVIRQYIDTVRPMHKKFIEPTKRNSHIIIPHGANQAALQMIVARIFSVLNNDVLITHVFDEEDSGGI